MKEWSSVQETLITESFQSPLSGNHKVLHSTVRTRGESPQVLDTLIGRSKRREAPKDNDSRAECLRAFKRGLSRSVYFFDWTERTVTDLLPLRDFNRRGVGLLARRC